MHPRTNTIRKFNTPLSKISVYFLRIKFLGLYLQHLKFTSLPAKVLSKFK